MTKLKTLGNQVKTLSDRVATINPDSWRATKETAAQRGYGYRWQKSRAGFLAKHPLCAYCQREGRVTAATVVDHAIPHRGDMAIFWDAGNWVPLCAHCHSSVKQREENRQGQGRP